MHSHKEQLQSRTFFYEKQTGPPRFGAPEKPPRTFLKGPGWSQYDLKFVLHEQLPDGIGVGGRGFGCFGGLGRGLVRAVPPS